MEDCTITEQVILHPTCSAFPPPSLGIYAISLKARKSKGALRKKMSSKQEHKAEQNETEPDALIQNRQF